MKKKLLILGLIMVVALTGCTGINTNETKAESGTDGTAYSYFKPIIEKINNDEDSPVEAKMNGATNTFQLIIKSGQDISDSEKAKEVVLAYSKGMMKETGAKGIKVEYVYERTKDIPLVQAKDGEITVDRFMVPELTEESIKDIATGIFDTTEVREVSIADGVVSMKYYKKGISFKKTTLDVNAMHTVDFLQLMFNNPEVKQVNLSMESELLDGKGNEFTAEIIEFQTTREKINDVTWVNMRELARKDYRNLGNIATVYKISEHLMK